MPWTTGGAPIWRRVAATQRYALALDAAEAGTWHWDRESGAVDWDPALERLFGLPEGSFGGGFEDWVACIHPDDREQVLATLQETLRTGGPHHVIYRTRRPDGAVRWIEGRGQALWEDGEIVGLVGACHDITERQEAEAERTRVLEAERRARERLELLAEASALLARSLDVDETLHDLVQLAVPRLGDWCAIELTDGEQGAFVTIAHEDAGKVQIAHELRERYGTPLDSAAGRELLAKGYVPEVTEELLRPVTDDDEHFDTLQKLGLRSMVIVPLTARSRDIGTLVLGHAESERTHSPEDYTLARELALRAAVAVDNARLFSERSRVASVLQRALLPPALPTIPGMDVASHYVTAEESDIGGDFYDVLGDENDWTLVIGDVRGKGTEAATVTSLARHTVRAAALRRPDPAHVLGVLNDALIEHDPWESFCTAVCARLRVGEGEARLRVAAGGHPPPLLLEPDGGLRAVEVSGTLLGLFPDLTFDTVDVALQPGELLFFYTDGLTEARRDGELFGLERLEATLAGVAGLPAEAALKQVYDAVTEFQTHQRDDMAMLALRLPPSPEATG